MRLLFITQKVDKDDDILGVYHRWIEKLAEKVEAISVICLYKGTVDLPRNVRVLSLGKESGRSRLKYVKNFYKHLRALKGEYDRVFVHMNPEYMLLGGLYWRFKGKKVAFWYNHPLGSLITKIGLFLANIVFFTSSFSFAAKNPKSVKMPVGIDINFLKKDPAIKKEENSVLYLGRISPIKNVDVLIGAAKKDARFRFLIVGDPTPGKKIEAEYLESIKKISPENVRFKKGVPYIKTPAIYNQHQIFVNLTDTGSLDKTTLEAMACQVPALVSNRSFEKILPEDLRDILIFKEKDVEDLYRKITHIFSLSKEERENIGKILRQIVIKDHSLDLLTNKIIEHLEV